MFIIYLFCQMVKFVVSNFIDSSWGFTWDDIPYKLHCTLGSWIFAIISLALLPDIASCSCLYCLAHW